MVIEVATILISIISGLILGTIIGFALTGHRQMNEGSEFYPKNKIARFFVTHAKDRTAIQNLLYFVGMVAWFFVFIALVAVPIVAPEKMGSSVAWVEMSALLFFFVSAFAGKVIGQGVWYKCI